MTFLMTTVGAAVAALALVSVAAGARLLGRARGPAGPPAWPVRLLLAGAAVFLWGLGVRAAAQRAVPLEGELVRVEQAAESEGPDQWQLDARVGGAVVPLYVFRPPRCEPGAPVRKAALDDRVRCGDDTLELASAALWVIVVAPAFGSLLLLAATRRRRPASATPPSA